MTMSHKAFGFRHRDFTLELLPILESPSMGRSQRLLAYARAHSDAIREPDTGESVDVEELDTSDQDFIVEVCLTRFYDPNADVGLGDAYLDVDRRLRSLAPQAAGLLAGPPLLINGVPFDPGKMGTFLLDEDALARQEEVLRSLPTTLPFGDTLARMLKEGTTAGGLLITF